MKLLILVSYLLSLSIFAPTIVTSYTHTLNIKSTINNLEAIGIYTIKNNYNNTYSKNKETLLYLDTPLDIEYIKVYFKDEKSLLINITNN